MKDDERRMLHPLEQVIRARAYHALLPEEERTRSEAELTQKREQAMAWMRERRLLPEADTKLPQFVRQTQRKVRSLGSVARRDVDDEENDV